MRHFLDFIRNESTDFRKPLVLAIFLAGVINGTGVAVAVNAVGSLKSGQIDGAAFVRFALCIAGYWFSKELVLNRTTVILEKIVERLRLRILFKIRDTELLQYEAMDKGRIYSALSSDAVNISTSAGMVINASSSLVMLGFTFLLLATLSLNALLITVGLILIVVVYYMKQSRYVGEQFGSAAANENEFFDNLTGFLSGFKELKLARNKCNDYFDEEIERVVRSTREHREEAGKAMNHSLLIAHTYLFFTLAGLIFVLPVLSPMETSVVPILVPVILFAAGPLADVVSSIPALAKAEASIVNIYQLERGVDARIETTPLVAGPTDIGSQTETFVSLRCEGLAFQYPNSGTHPFKIWPTDFELKAGQIVFIVGGNGSGKSTLLKMLTGLYRPDSGRILLNGEDVHPNRVTRLREMFSPIFTDFHLFKRVLGRQQVNDARIAELLERMELADKTEIVNGRITNLNLSTGQRKRLALVLATLDERPVHIFDEWAADQDPVFRKYFYEVLLREMVHQGKTVLAVTHDDHYFHVADKVFAMDYGQLREYTQPQGRYDQ